MSNGGQLMSSGGSDGTIRLWDLSHHACTHSLIGVKGVVSVLAFHPDAEKELVLAAGDNTKIFGWNTKTGQTKLALSGHFSRVTCLAFHEDGRHLVSSGRDKVIILWDIERSASVRILPVYEGIEGIFILPKDHPSNEKSVNIHVAAAGEKGIFSVWDMTTGVQVYTQKKIEESSEEASLAVTQLLLNNADRNEFAIVTADHNIIIHCLKTYQCKKQLVGYSDEILDVAYLGRDESHLAVATNSSDIKVYELRAMSCQLLTGHTDHVLSLATSPANKNLLVSSSKDNSLRIWLMDTDSMRVSCIGCARRHTASVGAAALSQTATSFFASVSQDLCLKIWRLPDKISITGTFPSIFIYQEG